MGKENIQVHGPITEAQEFFNYILPNILKNTWNDKLSLRQCEYNVFAYTDLEFKNKVEHGKARQICRHKSPCGFYGCVELGKHELYWIVVDDFSYGG